MIVNKVENLIFIFPTQDIKYSDNVDKKNEENKKIPAIKISSYVKLPRRLIKMHIEV